MASVRFFTGPKFIACWSPQSGDKLDRDQALHTLGPPRDSVETALQDVEAVCVGKPISAVTTIGGVLILEVTSAREVEIPAPVPRVRR